MRRPLLILLGLICPLLAIASNDSLSFAPPPGDYSVIFLGNMFGIVDGVLHGTGSQIMGSMFAVFNAAVLALGGIVIMYTLIVGTMNTAHEGQMLGQKWSSIWIPIRSTIGLSLLIPKASGYCLMQIFVMWVTVQGVGAADKVWDAALGYLNRGGVIVQAQMSSSSSLTADSSTIATGASTILSGQICMAGLQKQLETQRQSNLSAKDKKAGPCYGSPSGDAAVLCDTSVPDFMSSINTVYAQTAQAGAKHFSEPMPHFDSGSPFVALNGICGTIAWDPISATDINNINKYIASVSGSDMTTTTLSRAIAIQQMFVDLASVARNMVNNDPELNSNTGSSGSGATNFSDIATNQFGVPYLTEGTPCKDPSKNCTSWGVDPSSNSAPLFNGTEFQGAIADYNGIMMPTLNLISEASKGSSAEANRKFISQSESEGWILAGSYFFDLVQLNGSALPSGLTDTNSGLDASTFNTDDITSAFERGGSCSGKYSLLCQMLNKKVSSVNKVVGLIDGSSVLASPLDTPNITPSGHPAEKGVGSSTGYGYINNAVLVNLPNQPGLVAPAFIPAVAISTHAQPLKFHSKHFRCWEIGIGSCVLSKFESLLYNDLLGSVIQIFNNQLLTAFNYVMDNYLTKPLNDMANIFQDGVKYIEQPGVNPIIALAQMGSHYINAAMNLWIGLIGLAIVFGWIPGYAILISLISPILMTWLGAMAGIGFMTAYYIPFLPYMIFTFGAIAWLMAVVEAMVAGPIVALGVTHPEGEGMLGKGDHAIMILMNVFLRPSMMIVGYISGIALCYVSVWIINAGFGRISAFMTAPGSNFYTSANSYYTMWSYAFANFFVVLMYTMVYMTVVEKAFTLIHVLPDKVLRWIGTQPEQTGSETAQWGEQAKGQMKESGGKTGDAGGITGKKAKGYADQGMSSAYSMLTGKNKPPSPEGRGEA